MKIFISDDIKNLRKRDVLHYVLINEINLIIKDEDVILKVLWLFKVLKDLIN